MRSGQYNPEDVNLIVGTRQINNFADGTFINAVYETPKRIQAQMGSRGEYGLKYNPKRNGTITIMLLPDAPENAYLMSLANAKSIFPVLATRVGESLRDVTTGPEAWIEESPPPEYDGDAPTRTWVIGVGRLDVAFLNV